MYYRALTFRCEPDPISLIYCFYIIEMESSCIICLSRFRVYYLTDLLINVSFHYQVVEEAAMSKS